MSLQKQALQPGQRIRLTQVVDTREGPWQTSVEGVVKEVRARPTGSWFAHGKHDKLWLTRILLQKDDGELAELVLEPDSRIELLSGGSAAAR